MFASQFNKVSLNASIFSTDVLKPLLNATQKKTVFIAALIFSAIALGAFILFQLKNKKATQIENGNKDLDFKKLNENNNKNLEEKKEVEKETSVLSDEQQKEVEVHQKLNDPIDKDTPKTLLYTDEEIKKACDIFTQLDKDDERRKSYEVYFKSALLQPQDKINIKTFYRTIQEHSEIVDLIFNNASEHFSSDAATKEEKELIISNFCLVLDDLHVNTVNETLQNKEYMIFLQKLLKNQRFEQIIDHLSENKVKELIPLILKQASYPFAVLIYLFKIFKDQSRKELVLLPIDDGEYLEKVIYLSPLDKGLLSPKQIDILFQHWQKKFVETEFLEKVSEFFNFLIEKHQLKIIEDILKANPTIDLQKLMILNQKISKRDFSRILPYLCGFYVMKHLNGQGTLDEKIKEVHTAITFTDFFKRSYDDERIILGSFLAENCSLAQFEIIMLSFIDFIGPRQRIVEQFLKTVLKSKNLERIQHAFASYWPFYKKIKEMEPNCEWTLLNHIDDEQVLKAVYESIPSTVDDKEKSEIKELLLNGNRYYDFGHWIEYKVNLGQDVIWKTLQ
jgi:hypothetical protein